MSKSNRIVKQMEQSGGRFFGLKTKTGRVNAQFASTSPNYVTVWDRNANSFRKFAKKSLVGFSLGGVTV